MNENLTVAKITSKNNGQHNIKLEQRLVPVSTPLGNTPGGVANIYYITVDVPSVEVGQVISLEMDNFTINERSFIVDDKESANFGQTVTCKWLQPK